MCVCVSFAGDGLAKISPVHPHTQVVVVVVAARNGRDVRVRNARCTQLMVPILCVRTSRALNALRRRRRGFGNEAIPIPGQTRALVRCDLLRPERARAQPDKHRDIRVRRANDSSPSERDRAAPKARRSLSGCRGRLFLLPVMVKVVKHIHKSLGFGAAARYTQYPLGLGVCVVVECIVGGWDGDSIGAIARFQGISVR